MKVTTATEAISTIANGAALFDGNPADQAAARRARRTYRVLIALIHPDLAAAHGIAADDAQAAAAMLNDQYERWQASSAPQAQTAAAHVVGEHATYLLKDKVAAGQSVATYLTDQPDVRIDISRTTTDTVATTTTASKTLTAKGMGAFAANVTDHGLTAGHAWVAYQLPAGLVALRDIAAAYPAGLDGRDWAWMARRILMTLDAADTPHGNLNEDTILIHPEQHGVVLTGWRGSRSSDDDVAGIAVIFDHMVDGRSPGGSQQLGWAHALISAPTITPGRLLREYDLLLRRLYGERRYRPFTIPVAA